MCDTPEPKSFPRRGFLGRMMLAAWGLLATLALPRLVQAGKKVALPMGKLPDLKEVGGGLILKLKGTPILLIRKDKDTVNAISPECRHEKCQVLYNKDWGEIRCKCHGSRYNLDGEVINPPATHDLFYYKAKLDGERLLLDLEQITPDDG